VVSTLASKFLKKSADDFFLGDLDKLTVGMGMGTSIGMLVYLALKLIALAHGDHWSLLATPYGNWYLVEIFGFALAPALILAVGVKRQSAGIVRFGAFYAVLGIIVNRMNVSIVAFNWQLPHHFHHIIPPWEEVAVILAIFTIHVLIFRWILVRMPVIHQHRDYK
jgi:hypothetical protein